MQTPPIERCDTKVSANAGCRGFTLIELLVVMAIMAIVLGMTVAIGPGVLRSNAMSGGLSQVASAVSLARSEAVRARKPTVFVLAPIDPLGERSYTSYAVMQADSISGTNYTYITRWQKLPSGVLFSAGLGNTIFTNVASFPYPAVGQGPTNLPYMQFSPEGGLDEDKHAREVRVALQTGVRIATNSPPDYLGKDYVTNEVVVQRLSGKVTVERSGEVQAQ